MISLLTALSLWVFTLVLEFLWGWSGLISHPFFWSNLSRVFEEYAQLDTLPYKRLICKVFEPYPFFCHLSSIQRKGRWDLCISLLIVCKGIYRYLSDSRRVNESCVVRVGVYESSARIGATSSFAAERLVELVWEWYRNWTMAKKLNFDWIIQRHALFCDWLCGCSTTDSLLSRGKAVARSSKCTLLRVW